MKRSDDLPSDDRGNKRTRVLVVAQDLPYSEVGGRTWWIRLIRRLIDRPARAGISAMSMFLCRRGNGVIVANDYVADELDLRFPASSVLRYESDLLQRVEASDYAGVHHLADELEALSSRLAMSGGGFVHRGVSLVKVHEIRWIWEVAYASAAMDFFGETIKSRGVDRVSALGWSKQLPYAVQAARLAGIRFGMITGLAAHLSARQQTRYHRRFLKRMVPHYFGRRSSERAPAAPRGRARRLLVIGNFDRTMERFERLQPVLNDARFECHVLALPRVSLAARLEASGARVSLVGDWISDDDVQRVEALATTKGDRWWNEILQCVDREPRRFGGTGVSFESARVSLEPYVRQGAPSAMLAAEVAYRVMDDVRPDLVLNFEDWDFNRAVSLIAASRSVPSVAYYCLSAPGHAGMVRRTQPWMAVSGENLRRAFSGQYERHRICVVGDPLVRSQQLATQRLDRTALRERFGLGASRPAIVLLSTFPAPGLTLSEIRRIFQRTFDVARALDAQVVVKLHPAQIEKEVRHWMAAWDCGEASILQHVSLFDLCACADVVSAPITSAVHQAMFAGAPVVCLQSTHSIEPFESMGFDYLAGRGVVHVPTDQDAVLPIRRLLFDEAARDAQIARGFAHVEEHVGPLDGRAPERFAAFLEDILASTAASHQSP